MGPFYAFEGVDQRPCRRSRSNLNKGKTVRWEILQSKHSGEKPKAGKYFKVNTDGKETAQNFIPSHPREEKNMKAGGEELEKEKLKI